MHVIRRLYRFSDTGATKRLAEALSVVASGLDELVSIAPEARSRRTQEFINDVRVVLRQQSANVSQLEALVHSESEQETTRFAALYGLLHLHRRNHNFVAYRELVDHAAKEFGQYHLYSTFYTFYHRSLGNHRQALRYSEAALARLPSMPGVQHLHAAIVADLLDLSEEVSPDDIDSAIGEVRSIIDRLASADHGPRRIASYYETLARLQRHVGRFQEARTNIRLAMESESPGEPGYELRHANRLNLKWLIDVSSEEAEIREGIDASIQAITEASNELSNKQASVEAQLGEVRREVATVRDQTFTLLTLLTAVITFVVTSVQVATRIGLPSLMVAIPALGLLVIVLLSSAALLLTTGEAGSGPARALFVGSLLALIALAVLSIVLDLP